MSELKSLITAAIILLMCGDAGAASTPQFDPAVAEIPHIWQGVKGETSRTVRIFDKAAKNTLFQLRGIHALSLSLGRTPGFCEQVQIGNLRRH